MTPKHSKPKNEIKVVLFEGIHPSAEKYFKDNGYTDVTMLKKAYEGPELLAKVAGAYFIGVRSRTQLTAEVLEAAKRLTAVGCFCIGTNQVDLITAGLKGVPVFNAPHSNTRSVAELVIGQTIMLMREIFPKSVKAHDGSWAKSANGCNEVRGKTMGIVGYGHIGSQVSILAESLGMNVIYYDIQTKLPLGNAKPVESLDKLLKQSHVVTLHVPQSDGTRNMITAAQLDHMKKGAYLINASRGNVVVIEDLAEALNSGHIKGAAIDVFPTEPESNDHKFESPLCKMHNVILTPHIGGSTQEAQYNIALEVARKLVGFSDYGTTEGAVNFPNISLVAHEDAHRILHIHRNEPGVLGQINRILAEENINVVGQHLMTNQNIGYVVLDIEGEETQVSDRLSDALKTVKGTIRSRVIY